MNDNKVWITFFWNDVDGKFIGKLYGFNHDKEFYAECDDFDEGEEIAVLEQKLVFREKAFKFFARRPDRDDIMAEEVEMDVRDAKDFLRLALKEECFHIIDWQGEEGPFWPIIVEDGGF